MLKKVVFLDRDGVINYDSFNYIKTVDEFILIPGSLSAIAKLTRNGYSVFVITNQSAIARRLADTAMIHKIHQHLEEAVHKAGGKIDGIYFCPHHPDNGCRCRKPRTGLIEKAAEENPIDIGSAVMVGDKLTDMECGKRAGCKSGFLVRTGLITPLKADHNDFFQNFYQQAQTLFHAVDLLVHEDKTKGGYIHNP